jgi:YbbR domain-containing protein
MSGRGVLDNFSSIVMALVVALIVWLLASEEGRPMRTVEPFPATGEAGLTIEARNLPAGRAAYDLEPRQARVSLRGMDDALKTLQPADMLATVDLAGAAPDASEARAPVTVRCPSCARRGIRITRWEPTEITLKLADEVTAVRRVTAVAADESPSGYARTYEVSPTEVTLRGAAPALARVREVVARLGRLAGVSGDQHVPNVPVSVLDARQEPVPDVAANPPAVAVTVVLRRRDVEVAVSPTVRGADAVGDGYYLTGISVDPQFVSLEGPAELVQSIRERGSIPTRQVDVTGARGDVQKRVSLDLPRGVTAANAADGVTVTVKLEPLPGTVTRELPVTVTGVGPGLEVASVSPDKVTVLVSGPRPLLDRLSARDVQAVVDMTGKSAGPHRMAPEIRLPAEVQLRSITPGEVEVVLRGLAAAATPTARAGGRR